MREFAFGLRQFGGRFPRPAAGGVPPLGPQRVILVTDYAGDCDDAPAVLLACDAHERGEINLLGIVASSTVATSAPGIYGQLAAYNMTHIPVYAYQGSLGTYNNRISAPVRDLFGVAGQTRTAFQSDVVGLRTMLAAAPDASVKIIDVGAPISTSLLLDSPADGISPLTGRQLVAAKVVGLWMMAGNFTSSTPEYNADRHVASTQNVYQTWPTPVYAHGGEVGMTVFTAPRANASPVTDPVKVAFDAFGAASPGSLTNYLGRMARQSWDPICVHHAIYGDQGLYNLAGANGTITVSGTGVTTWSATPAGNKSYVGKAATDAAIAAAIQAKIDNTIVEQNANAAVPSAPAAPTVSGVGTSRTFSWGRPASGGSPIETYVLRLDGTVLATVPGNQFTFTQAGLEAGNRSLTVQATNQIGAGSQSAAASFTVEVPASGPEPTQTAWGLTEGSGTTVTSTNQRTGGLTSVTWGASPTRLVYPGSTNNRMETLIQSSEDHTFYMMGAVCRPSSVSGTRQIAARMGATTDDRYFQFRIISGALEFVSFSASPNTEATILTAPAGSVTANEWVMLTAVVDRGASNTQISMRKNGVQIHSGAAPLQKVPTFGAPVLFGTRAGGSDPFVGDMAALNVMYTGARAAGIAAFEAELRAIATAKGISLP